MPFAPKHVLLIGATSGIGHAMAVRLVREGSQVTAVGRRKDRLDAFVTENGSRASAEVFDVGETEKIPAFAQKMIKTYPDLDCLFLNAGTQMKLDLTAPESFDLEAYTREMKVNYTSLVALTMAFLPFLLKKPSSIIFTGSNLAVVPGVAVPGYSASKAALNSFTLCLRAQLASSSVKVLEISPPAVQTELHDYAGQERGRKIGMPLDQFTDEAFKGLEAGKDQIVIGSIGPGFQHIIDMRRGAFEDLAKMMMARR